MMNPFRLCIAGLLSLAFVVGCVDDGQEAPPVMEAMNSFEELKQEAEDKKMQDLRDKMAKERAAMGDSQSGSDTMAGSLPQGVPASGKFTVQFSSTAGSFTIEVNREWSPVGADRFYKLVKDGFYDEAGFFRVVPDFMVQFGLAADPAMTAKWSQTIKDDPVVKSNRRGYVTFAKTGAPNSRSGQIFISYKDNSFLDGQGFSPFGIVTEGMDSVDKINSEYGEQPNQGSLTHQGNLYLKGQFPNLDYVTKAVVVDDDLEGSDDSK
ncbi:MAG: peptidylprolyl isomerase [Fuerstiella sp.]